MNRTLKPAYTRRQILRSLVGAGATGMLTGLGGTARATTSYGGKLLVNLQLQGGLDVTSFADPKGNVPGSPVINNWARSAELRQAGNIRYAPFAQNAAFFDKYYRDMLVINGVDAQTNSHTVGVLHNWSGRNSEGYPTLTALFAAVNQFDQPMPYLNFGGFASTAGITDLTQIGRMTELYDLVRPNLAENGGNRYVEDSDWQRITAMHRAGLAARSAAPTTLEAAALQQQAYAKALERSSAISDFADVLPTASTLQAPRYVGDYMSRLHQHMQVTLLAFKSGMSLAADLFEPGFDTHDNHDALHAAVLGHVTDAIDFFWTYAAQLGLAERIVLVVGSDFGRTPHYNANSGKDHWPIGSVLVMQKNAGFTNRVVGLTDSGHNAVNIHPQTLQADSVNGVTLHPAHVHKALRKQLGLHTSGVSQLFPFASTPDVEIFG
jgi:hypothetical protein